MPEPSAPPSATDPDWSRERQRPLRPGQRLLRAIRGYQRWAGRRDPLAAVMRRRWALSHRIWSVLTHSDIPVTTRVGGGLLLPHAGGIVIHPDAVLGPNCTLMGGVTIGLTRQPGAPVLKGGVDVGAGACILGPITIGARAQIGANAVVLRDVPPGRVAVGVPARVRAPTGGSATAP